MAEITYLEAIREAMFEEMARDENVFCLGEDIGAFGGAFKVTDGLQAKFGEQRVIDVRDELLLLIGDAAAFQYSINGVTGRRLGPPGEVRRIRITRENYSEFQDG